MLHIYTSRKPFMKYHTSDKKHLSTNDWNKNLTCLKKTASITHDVRSFMSPVYIANYLFSSALSFVLTIKFSYLSASYRLQTLTTFPFIFIFSLFFKLSFLNIFFVIFFLLRRLLFPLLTTSRRSWLATYIFFSLSVTVNLLKPPTIVSSSNLLSYRFIFSYSSSSVVCLVQYFSSLLRFFILFILPSSSSL